MNLKDIKLEQLLVVSTLILFAVVPNFACAIVFVSSCAYAVLIKKLEPVPQKNAEAERVEALIEEVKLLRSEAGMLKAAIGLSSHRGKATPRVSVFREAEPKG